MVANSTGDRSTFFCFAGRFGLPDGRAASSLACSDIHTQYPITFYSCCFPFSTRNFNAADSSSLPEKAK
jgi:hypothetical protein